METQPRIFRGRTEIYVPNGASEIIYVTPAVGPNTYQNVGRQIITEGLVPPTGDETALLIHQAYAGKLKDGTELKEVRDIVQKRFFWAFNRNLWTQSGMFSTTDRKAIGRSQELDEEVLDQAIKGGLDINGVRFSQDGTVRFAPKGSYTFGEMSAEELAKDGAMIAQYGVEGAKLLAEASTTRKNKPITYGLNIQKGQTPQIHVSTLDENGSRLRFGGLDDFFCVGGCAFGVRALSAKKI